MIVYRTRTCNTSCNTITLTYTTITSFMFDGLGTWVVQDSKRGQGTGSSYLMVLVYARTNTITNTDHEERPTFL